MKLQLSFWFDEHLIGGNILVVQKVNDYMHVVWTDDQTPTRYPLKAISDIRLAVITKE